MRDAEEIIQKFYDEGEARESEAASRWMEEIKKRTREDREKQDKDKLAEPIKEELEDKPEEKNILDEKPLEIKAEIPPEELISKEKDQKEVESLPETKITPEPVQEPTTPITLLFRRSFFETIKPIKDKSPKKNIKLTMDQGAVMEDSDGETNLVQILDKNKMNYSNLVKILDFLIDQKLIKFPDHEFVKVHCPECKKEAYLFIPNFIKENCVKFIRAQIFPLECDHTFIALFDKKLKVITKPIQKLLKRRDVLDITDINIQTLISYFGQDLTFYIFHEVFYEKNVIFIASWNIIQYFVAYIDSIFRDYATNPVITSIDLEEFEKNSKQYKDDLIIDLNSLISLDPSDKELTFGFQVTLFLESPEAFENFYKTHMRGK